MKLIAELLTAAALTVTSGRVKTDWIDRTLVTESVTGTWSGNSPSGGENDGSIQ